MTPQDTPQQFQVILPVTDNSREEKFGSPSRELLGERFWRTSIPARVPTIVTSPPTLTDFASPFAIGRGLRSSAGSACRDLDPVGTHPRGERLRYLKDPWGNKDRFVEERTPFTGQA